MFDIKVFPDFRSTGRETGREEAIRRQLAVVRDNTSALFVNASFVDYGKNGAGSVHYLTYPMRWITHYVTSHYSNVDPLLQLDFRGLSVIDWRDLHVTAQQQDMLDAFHDSGLGNQGLTLVVQVERDIHCVLSVSFSMPDEAWAQRRQAIVDQMRAEGERLSGTFRQHFLRDNARDLNITRREVECLYWVAMGKTDEQIGSLLNIGKWTVNGYLQSAKCKLGTPSRSAAVARAITAGIITLGHAG